MAKTYWMRFYSADSDPRPITVPAPCEWWCTGYDSKDRAVICALVKAAGEPPWERLKEWWPDLVPDSADYQPSSNKLSDRFPRKSESDNGWREVVL